MSTSEFIMELIQMASIAYLWFMIGRILKMFGCVERWMEEQQKINASLDRDIERISK